MLEINKIRSKYHARFTLQILGVSEINYEHILRGIHSGSIDCSLIIEVGKICKVYLSAFCQNRSQKVVEQISLSKVKALKSLLVGCRFNSTSFSKPQKVEHSVLFQILGKPKPEINSQLTSFINSLISVNIPAFIVINIQPVTVNYQSMDDKGIGWKSKKPISYDLNKDHMKRTIDLLRDCSFWTTFGIFLQNDDISALERHVGAVQSIIGSVYDSEASDIKLLINWRKKALKYAQRLFQGEMLYATLLHTRELAAYFQFPQSYGIEDLKLPIFDIPYEITKGLEIGNILGNFNEELYPINIDPNSLFEHLVLWGASGTGKSTFLKNFIIKLHNQIGLKSLVFDFHNEYREIITKLNGKIGKDIIIINPYISPFSLNLLELPKGDGIDKSIAIDERIENIISLLEELFIFGDVQESQMRNALYQLYEKHDLLFENLVKTLYIYKCRALASKLRKFTQGLYGDIFNQKQSTLSFDKIEQATVIFELGNIPSGLRTFFISVFLILWWDFKRTRRPDEAPPHILILDEFHNYSDLSVIRKMLSEARKFRQGLICASQGPNQITDQAILEDLVRNTATKIIFRQDQRTDKITVGTALGGLNREQYDYLSLMETGEALVKMKNIKHTFRMKTYPMPELKKITDEELKNLIPVSILKPKVELVKPKPIEISSPKVDYEMAFLRIVSEKPSISITDVIKDLQIQRKKGFELKQKLISNGLLLEENIRKGRGRPKKLLKLTKDGYEILGVQKQSKATQHGGEEHIHIKDKVAEVLMKSGWEVKIEHQGCDVVGLTEDGHKIAIEIETLKHNGYDQIITNIKRDKKWADQICIICPNRDVIGRIKRNVIDINYPEIKLFAYQQIDKLPEIILGELNSN